MIMSSRFCDGCVVTATEDRSVHEGAAGAGRVILQVLGPTGVGKSRISVELAKIWKGEVVSADSMQVYKGFDIGTDKIRSPDHEGIVHYGIDVYEPHEQSSAYRFLHQAWEWCRVIEQNGHLPIICGGTALYLRVMSQGVFSEKESSDAFRAQLQERLEKEGLEALWQALNLQDPDYARKIGNRDERRILRAHEIIHNTGLIPTQAFKQNETPFSGHRFIRLGLMMDRKQLYERIDARVDRMVARGLLEETEALLKRYPPTYPPFQAVGYKEMVSHLQGHLSFEDAVKLIKQHSRNYAKRQMTWWRQEPDIHWFQPSSFEEISEFVGRELQK